MLYAPLKFAYINYFAYLCSMKRKMQIFPFILLVALVSSQPAGANSCLDSLLNVYDNELTRADEYFSQRLCKIDSLRHLPATDELRLQQAELWFPYQSDSALYYYSLASKSRDDRISTYAKIKHCYLLAAIGSHIEAEAELRDLTVTDSTLYPEYYRMAYRYYYEAGLRTKEPGFRERLNEEADQALDALIGALGKEQPRSAEYYHSCGTRANARGNYTSALRYSDSTLIGVSPWEHPYAIYAFERAIIFRSMNQLEAYREWLVRSAITDVRCGIADNGSSWMVAQECFERGDLKRALRYINYSLSNANIFNAPSRAQQIEPLAIYIIEASNSQLHLFYSELSVLLVIALLMLIIAVLTVAWAWSRNAKLNRQNTAITTLNRRLNEANTVKEQYICRYLEVYSNNIARMVSMVRKTDKDASAFFRTEMAAFYRNFDQTFVTLYPMFVKDFNALLRPECQIMPKQGELLTTELRIFALIRLGIDSSAKIAQLLSYSPNTIYNYRAQIRNHAIDRDRFEEQVHHIGRPQS